jgi:hypothetical protein
MKALTMHQKKTLKQIQHLPEKTADAAVYLLLGALPVRARIELNQLTLFMMAIDGSSLERDIAERQLAMKDLKSKSWFMNVCRLLNKYDLPSAHDIFINPPSKSAWKRMIHSAVVSFWDNHLKKGAEDKSSLKYFNPSFCGIGKTHPIWDSVDPNQRDVYTEHQSKPNY